jgi:hypothetical protein
LEGEIILNWTVQKWEGRAWALEYVIRQIAVDVNLSYIHKSWNLCGFTKGMNIVGRTVQTVVKV